MIHRWQKSKSFLTISHPYLREKLRLVVDLYDSEKYADNQNYYDHRNPLTAKNKISPPST